MTVSSSYPINRVGFWHLLLTKNLTDMPRAKRICKGQPLMESAILPTTVCMSESCTRSVDAYVQQALTNFVSFKYGHHSPLATICSVSLLFANIGVKCNNKTALFVSGSMAGRLEKQVDIDQLQDLVDAGYSKKDIADQVGICRNTLNKFYIGYI